MEWMMVYSHLKKISLYFNTIKTRPTAMEPWPAQTQNIQAQTKWHSRKS